MSVTRTNLIQADRAVALYQLGRSGRSSSPTGNLRYRVRARVRVRVRVRVCACRTDCLRRAMKIINGMRHRLLHPFTFSFMNASF
jgi:hypothetical protein